ncbi:hypothetical protein LguiA_016717 [Lonicera macranthoides]
MANVSDIHFKGYERQIINQTSYIALAQGYETNLQLQSDASILPQIEDVKL